MKRGEMKENKRAQSMMSMPYGLIFSIILIVVFIVAAFIVINHFLELKDCTLIGNFEKDLQTRVDDAFYSQVSNFNFPEKKPMSSQLPSGVKKVCFANLSAPVVGAGARDDYDEIAIDSVYTANFFIIPFGKACNMEYKLIENINITEITKNRNPYCIDTTSSLKIKKDIYDKSVLIQ